METSTEKHSRAQHRDHTLGSPGPVDGTSTPQIPKLWLKERHGEGQTTQTTGRSAVKSALKMAHTPDQNDSSINRYVNVDGDFPKSHPWTKDYRTGQSMQSGQP